MSSWWRSWRAMVARARKRSGGLALGLSVACGPTQVGLLPAPGSDTSTAADSASSFGSSDEGHSSTGEVGEVAVVLRENPDIVTNPFAEVAAEGAEEVLIRIETPDGRVLERQGNPGPEGFVSFLWGLRGDSEYSITAEARWGAQWASSEPVTYTTASLPPGLPDFELLQVDRERVHEGLVIVPATDGEQLVFVGLDVDANIAWYRFAASTTSNKTGGDARLLPDGRIVLRRSNGVDIIEPWGELVWSDQLAHHHDLVPTPEGGWLAIDSDFGTFDIDKFGGPTEVAYDLIREYGAEGQLLRSWSTVDHLDIQYWPSDLGQNSEPYRWTHSNGLVYQPQLGRVLLSSRHHSSIYAIAWPQGDVLWRLGPGGDFEIESGGWFYNQHSPEPQPDGSLLLYDNGNERPSSERYSRALWMDIDEDAMTAAWRWEYRIEPLTLTQGDADLLPNGNVLSCAGGNASPAAYPRLIETTTAGTPEVVWEVQRGDYDFMYRATHVESMHSPGGSASRQRTSRVTTTRLRPPQVKNTPE